MNIRPFHVAFPVVDLVATQQFYETVLGCRVGRTSDRWIDFNLFGHQITAHLSTTTDIVGTNPVDGQSIPVRHFGVILTLAEWDTLVQRLKTQQVKFLVEPSVRFRGEVGEQATLFIQDPSGNALEFKAFGDDASIFAS